MTIDELRLVLEQVEATWIDWSRDECRACHGSIPYSSDPRRKPAAKHAPDCRYVRVKALLELERRRPPERR